MAARVASASATADVGTSPVERRTTVRGGRTFHDDGSCGGFLPLAGTGGAVTPPEDRVEPPGDHGVRPARPADRRTAPPGGIPTVGTTAVRDPPDSVAGPEPAGLVAGAPAPEDEPEANGRPPAPPHAPAAAAEVPAFAAGPLVGPCLLDVPTAALVAVATGPGALAAVPEVVAVLDVLEVLADVLEVLADVLEVLGDGDPARRRTGDAAERIDAPAADAPPAAATTVGDMSRNA